MPELPEVETVRRDLQQRILNKKIVQIELRSTSILRNSPAEFKDALKNQACTDIDRIGKLLIFSISNGSRLLAHLKMTGQFLYRVEGKEVSASIFPLLYASTPGGEKTAGHFQEQQAQRAAADQHTHVILTFADQSTLSFRDQRKFGYLQIASPQEVEQVCARFGPDPLRESFTRERFAEAFSHRKKSLKAVLMDQRLIAGIGNIYADEICHRVGLLPQRSVRRLKEQQLERLFQATTEILNQAVDNRGTTLQDFTRPDGTPGKHGFELQVYHRENSSCLSCEHGTIKKIRHLGRGTHFCPSCQR